MMSLAAPTRVLAATTASRTASVAKPASALRAVAPRRASIKVRAEAPETPETSAVESIEMPFDAEPVAVPATASSSGEALALLNVYNETINGRAGTCLPLLGSVLPQSCARSPACPGSSGR